MGTKLDKYADLKNAWETPVMIESHINGVRQKYMNPNTPISYEELIDDAFACWEADATAMHAHNTDLTLQGPEAADDYRKVWGKVHEKYPDLFWYPTITPVDPEDEDQCGLEHYGLLKDTGVHAACLDSGMNLIATNTDEDEDENEILEGITYGWTLSQIGRQAAYLRKEDLNVIWGIYDPGFAKVALYYMNTGYIKKATWDFYLFGDYGLASTQPINVSGMSPTYESLYYYLSMIEDCRVKIPWFVSIWGEGDGETRRKIIKRTIELGGHIKTGLEMSYEKNANPTNLELLKEAQEIAREVGRPLATREEALKMYGAK